MHLPYSEICYEYGWVLRELETGPSVTQIRYDKHTTTYFCVNYPASARELLLRRIREDPVKVVKPLLVDAICCDASVRFLRSKIMDLHNRIKEHVSLGFRACNLSGNIWP
jgi:hypothetical protein